MGGRGSSSAISRSVSTGDRSLDKIVSKSLDKYKDISIKNKLQENMAKKTLSKMTGDPITNYKKRMKTMAENHNRNLKEVSRFKSDIKRREASLKKEEALLKSYSKETRTMTDVRGNSVKTNSKRYEVQAEKVKMLNDALRFAHSNHRAKKKAVESFSATFAKEADLGAKNAQRAKKYKKKK